MCISELNNTGESGDFEALRNNYTDRMIAKSDQARAYDNGAA